MYDDVVVVCMYGAMEAVPLSFLGFTCNNIVLLIIIVPLVGRTAS